MTLEENTCTAFTPVTNEERAAAAAGPTDAATHAAWFARLACLHEVEAAPADARGEVAVGRGEGAEETGEGADAKGERAEGRGEVAEERGEVAEERGEVAELKAASPAAYDAGRVLGWNVERGRNPEALAALIARERAELVLLSETDVGMARSGNLHTPREVARRLGFGFVCAVEFVELGLGGTEERAACAGQANANGLHGGAILSATPLERPALVRLEQRASWFDGARGERRIGGRVAVLATWRWRGQPVTVAAVHLESHSDPDDRCAQLTALLDGIDAYHADAPVLIAGDLNTFSVPLADLGDRPKLLRALAQDPERLRHPVPHEPLFAIARERGYACEHCNVHAEPTHRVSKTPHASARGGLKLDWFLTRGLVAAEPRVVDAAGPRGEALSDHEAITVRIRA